MSEVKISQLDTLADMTDTAVIPVVEGGETKKVAGSALRKHVGNANIVPTANNSFFLGNSSNIWNGIHANTVTTSFIFIQDTVTANDIIGDSLAVNTSVNANSIISNTLVVNSDISAETITCNTIVSNASLEMQTSNELRLSAVDDNTGGGKVRIASGNGGGTPYAIEFHPGTQAEVDNLVAKIDNDGLEVNGTVLVSDELSASILKTSPVLLSELANASVAGAGARAFISDAETSSFGSAVAGGGANIMPVFSNGIDWLIG